MRANLETAQSRITELEKQLAQNQTPASPSQPENTAASDETSEKLESLTRDNASLQASLRDARNELSAYKRDFRSEVDAAKKEVTNSNQALRREAADAVRQMQQSKKRADNNHKL